MVPQTYPSNFASNGQSQMRVSFLTNVIGLKRWTDYIPVKLSTGGVENSYDNNGYINVSSVTLTPNSMPFNDYVPVYVDASATDTWQVNDVGYIPYGYAMTGDASLMLDFTNGTALDSRITFTRASSATRTNSAGLIESVASDVPRFDYDPVTLAPKGLLIEEQRTNLLTYSEQFDDAAWVKNNVTVTPNTSAAPNGSLTADAVVATPALTSHYVDTSAVSFISGTPYTQSAYVKLLGPAGYRFRLRFNSVAFTVITSADFDLTTGTVTSTSGAITASTTAVGNGWYRCSATATATATVSSDLLMMLVSTTGSQSFSGDDVSGYDIWGAQLEAGAFATSYIPTVESQVTRAADTALMTGTNFSSWYNQTEGTFVTQWSLAGDTKGKMVYQAEDGTNANLLRQRYGTTGTADDAAVIVGSVVQAVLGSTTDLSVNVVYKSANAYAVNNFARSVSGNTVSTDSGGIVPTVNRISIGYSAISGVEQLCGYIQQLAYFPRRLSNSELQGITA
jgi:hypothetical protein